MIATFARAIKKTAAIRPTNTFLSTAKIRYPTVTKATPIIMKSGLFLTLSDKNPQAIVIKHASTDGGTDKSCAFTP